MQAKVHVGNGGGEAEQIILQMSTGLKYWAKACNENVGVCGKIKFNNSDIKSFDRDIIFASEKSIPDRCTPEAIQLSYESLYINLDIPKPAIELAEILIKTLLECGGMPNSSLAQLNFFLDPRIKKITPYSIILLNGTEGDVITAEEGNDKNINLNSILTQKLKCDHYRIKTWIQNSFSVQCLENDVSYLVRVNRDSYGLDFKVWIESQE